MGLPSPTCGAMKSANAAQPATLPRQLGVISTTSVLVGVVIGSGIFRVPAQVAAQVGTVGGTALIWILGAGITLAGALVLAELCSAYPQAGGTYVFLREAWGPQVAFLFGWAKLLITGPAGLAAVCLVFAAYAATFVPLGDSGQRVLAGVLLVVLSLTNIRSVRWTAAVQSLSTAAKVVSLIALAVLLLGFGNSGNGALSGPLSMEIGGWGGFGVALIAVLWTYVGWVDLTYLAGEVLEPARTFPRAVAGGLVLVMLVYLLVNAAYLYVLPTADIAHSSAVAATAAERVFGAAGRSLVAALVMLSTFGSLNGTMLSNPRVFFAMAQDGLFFRSVAAVHPRYRTPYVAILVFMVLGLIGVSSRTFEQLAELFVLGIWPFYALAVGAVFVLRRRYPEATRRSVYRMWGYPVLPAGFLIASTALLVNGAIKRPLQTAVSLGILLLGLPAHYGWRLLQSKTSVAARTA